MQLPNDITPEAHAALVECLRVLAARGRRLREERERQQKTESPSNLAGAGDSVGANGTLSIAGVSADAN